MTDDPRHFALHAALRRMRVHLEQAVADNDAAIAAWDAIDDRRIDANEVEVTHFEDTEHQFQNAETGERRSGTPVIPRRWPGPWFIESHGIMDSTRSRTICMFGNSDQDSADARLVAAAPDLLRLLATARECEGLQEWVPDLCDEIDALTVRIRDAS